MEDQNDFKTFENTIQSLQKCSSILKATKMKNIL